MVEITNEEFRRLAVYIKDNFGIHLNSEKKALAAGRLSFVLQSLNMDNFSDYLNYIMNDRSGEAARTFINKMTTNHTFFMREADHFHYFADAVLPKMTASMKDKDLRVWSAGCSTGEEAYTLAILTDEYLGDRRSEWDKKLLATDISDEVLRRAKEGIYDQEAVAAMPRRWQLAYFNRIDHNRYAVIDRMKREVIFRRFNLMDPFPFKRKFHVIFCRNVMIYFDTKTKTELIRKFYDSLETGGYLFIGHSESITRDQTGFQYVMPAVYRK